MRNWVRSGQADMPRFRTFSHNSNHSSISVIRKFGEKILIIIQIINLLKNRLYNHKLKNVFNQFCLKNSHGLND